MKQIEQASLGFKLQVLVPETVEEYDTLAKKQGACLESAVANVLYRGTLAKFRKNFVAAVENNTGIKRETEPTGKMVKDDEGNEVPQLRFIEAHNTEAKYFESVCAQLVAQGKFDSPEAAAASFQDLAQKTIESIAFDPSEREPSSGGPKTVAKTYINLAEKAQAAGKLGALAEKLREKLGVTWKVEETVDSVARAVAEDQRRIREATKLTQVYDVE